MNESRTSIAILFGIFVSLLLVMMIMDIFVMCNHYKENCVADEKIFFNNIRILILIK